MMFDSILFPTDFSSLSDAALDYAIRLAQSNDSKLTVFHAYRLIKSENEESLTGRLSLKQQLEQKAALSFERWDAALKKSGLRYSFISEVGFLNDRINSVVSAEGIDLIVMCNEIRNKLLRADHGAAEDFMQNLLCPVMLIPACAQGSQLNVASSANL